MIGENFNGLSYCHTYSRTYRDTTNCASTPTRRSAQATSTSRSRQNVQVCRETLHGTRGIGIAEGIGLGVIAIFPHEERGVGLRER